MAQHQALSEASQARMEDAQRALVASQPVWVWAESAQDRFDIRHCRLAKRRLHTLGWGGEGRDGLPESTTLAWMGCHFHALRVEAWSMVVCHTSCGVHVTLCG